MNKAHTTLQPTQTGMILQKTLFPIKHKLFLIPIPKNEGANEPETTSIKEQSTKNPIESEPINGLD